MKITGGTSRGTALAVPPGKLVRPTRDAVRQALFNVLGDWIVGKRVLDLYAGSGSLGLEALSRGAESSVFVEQDEEVRACLEANIERAGLATRARIEGSEVLHYLQSFRGKPAELQFDCILADPPFALSNTEELGELVKGLGSDHLWAQDELVCVVEVEAERADLRLLERLPGKVEFRRYGRNLLAIARRSV